MNTLAALSAALRSRLARLADALATRFAALGRAIARRARPVVAPLSGAVAGLVADGPVPPVALAAAVVVVAAGLSVVAPLALVGLEHLAVACALDVVLRR